MMSRPAYHCAECSAADIRAWVDTPRWNNGGRRICLPCHRVLNADEE